MKKRMLLMVAALLLLFGGLFGYDYHRKVQAAMAFAGFRPPPVAVAVSRAELREMPRTLAAIGTLEAVRQVTIAPEVSGRVIALYFQPGDQVRAGQPLLQTNDAPERGDLQRLQARARLARINLDRAQRLVKFAISQSELDAKRTELDEVEADILKTQALIAQKLIRAPFSGVLGMRQVHLGQYLNPGDAIVTLTDLSTLYVNFTLPEQTSGQLAVGNTVNFTVDAYPGRNYVAHVIAVEPQIGVDTHSIQLQARLDNRDGSLAPGMFANASLVLASGPAVLMVPETALDYTIHGDSIYRVRKVPGQGNGAAAFIATRALVETGSRIDDYVVIRAGLSADDLVVTVGQLKLHDGAEVAPVKTDSLTEAAAIHGSRLE